jgi:hypothetical protein
MPKRRNSAGSRLSPAAVVFALLVIATLAAFAYAQRVKRDPLLVDKVHLGTNGQHAAFTPNGDCRNDKIRIRFRTTVSDDADVQIVKPGGKVVVTLARDVFLKRYHFHTFYWDGRQRGGGTARRGRYKVRVKLLGEDRTLVLPGTIHVHQVAPQPGPACAQAGSRS